VPDTFIACLTPLLNSGGPILWINHGFLAGDVTTSGLTGNGLKWLDTGMIDTSMFSSVNDIGFALYATGENTIALHGILTGDFNSGYMLQPNRSGTTQWYDYGPPTGGTGNLHATAPAVLGYFCGTRTSSSAEALYFANSSNPHAALATGSTAPSYALIGRSAYIFNDNGFSLIDTRTLSFSSFSTGLSSSDSSHQYNRVQAMRTALGGGFN